MDIGRAFSAAAATVAALVLAATTALAAPPGTAAVAPVPTGQAAAAPAASATYKTGITTADLNLRTGPGVSYPKIDNLRTGTRVSLVSKQSNGWWRISIGGTTGYVNGSYLRFSTTATVNALGYAARGLAFHDKGPNKTGRVVLTFDDCPKTLASFDAATLYARDNNIGLVVAPTGNCVSAFTSRYGVDIVARARARGQYVINHSVSHPDLRKLSCASVAAQLKGSGVRTNYGRPPYGGIDAGVECGYSAAGLNIWTWDADTQDWKVKNKATTISRAVNRASAGSTVLMHMQWYGFSPDSLRQIRAGLSERGLSVCRAYRGMDNAGGVITSPRFLPPSLPC